MVLCSCKKEKPESEQTPDNTTPDYVLPNTVGSYWVYEKYNVDSLGNENYLSVDTLFITGDTIINGYTYTAFNSVFNTLPHPDHLRDSSGYIIDELGIIYYSYVNLGDTLFSFDGYVPGPNGNYYQYRDDYMLSNLGNISTSVGQFSCYIKRSAIRDSAGGSVNVCGDLQAYGDQYYASNVGLIRYENWFYASMILECERFYFQLADYYIAP
jgi:hypothetical protein